MSAPDFDRSSFHDTKGKYANKVVLGAELAEPALAGVRGPPGVGLPQLAMFVMAVDLGRSAAGLNERDDAAALVGVEPALA